MLPDALIANRSHFAAKTVYDRSPSGLNEPPEVTLPSPFFAAWDDFLDNPSWRIWFWTMCQFLIRQGDRFTELKPVLGRIQQLNNSETYDQLVSGFRSLQPELASEVGAVRRSQSAGAGKLPHELGEILGTVAQLKDAAEAPKFRRCFLALGNVGSGKTSFLVQLLDRSKTRKGPLVIVLDPTPVSPSR